MTIGILHPGNMGATVASTLRNAGHHVLWASQGRREQSKQRAAQVGLEDAGTVGALAERSELILSICPPEFADAVADEILNTGFRGIFVDANAIAPSRVRAMAERFKQAGIRFVDGGIIGAAAKDPNQLKPRTVWLYLSGPDALTVADCFGAGLVLAEVVGVDPGQASGLKMCFAAYNKGRAALMATTLAAAESFGVRDIIHQQWELRGQTDPAEAERFVAGNAPKAWRWAAEMREISQTFAEAGLPGDFHEGAAKTFERLSAFKDQERPSLQLVLAAILKGGK